jgi:hypothetical protein
MYVDEVTANRRLPIEVTQTPWRSRSGSDRLPQGPADDVQDLLNVAVGVALFGRMSDAALNVILEDEKRHGVYRRPQSRRLLEDVDAVLSALDHALDATDLARDAAKSPNQDRLVARIRVAKGRVEFRTLPQVTHCLGNTASGVVHARSGGIVLNCQLDLTPVIIRALT